MDNWSKCEGLRKKWYKKELKYLRILSKTNKQRKRFVSLGGGRGRGGDRYLSGISEDLFLSFFSVFLINLFKAVGELMGCVQSQELGARAFSEVYPAGKLQ